MCFPVNYILLLCISKLSVWGSVKTSCLSFTCRWSRSVSYQRWLRQRWITIDSPWRSWRSSMAKYRTGIFNYMLQIRLKPSHIPSQSSFSIFPCILLSSLQLICLHRKICCEYIIAMFLANMHWVYAHIFCSSQDIYCKQSAQKRVQAKVDGVQFGDGGKHTAQWTYPHLISQKHRYRQENLSACVLQSTQEVRTHAES